MEITFLNQQKLGKINFGLELFLDDVVEILYFRAI